MRKDIERKPEESDIDWLNRLHQTILESGSVKEADPEVITVILNNLPILLTEVSLGRQTITDLKKRLSGPRTLK